MNGTKKCPCCAEIIQAEAIKCVHCREFIAKCTRTSQWPSWTGFKGKTLWEWLGLLVVPLMLAGGGILFSRLETDRQRELTRQDSETSAAIEATQLAQNTEATRAAQATEAILATQGAEAVLAAQANATAEARNSEGTVRAAQAAEAMRIATATEARRATEAAEAISIAQANATAEAEISEATVQAAQTEVIETTQANATAEARNSEATVRAAQAAEATRGAQAIGTGEAIRATEAIQAISTAQANATTEAGNSEATVRAVQTTEANRAAQVTAAQQTAEAQQVETTPQTSEPSLPSPTPMPPTSTPMPTATATPIPPPPTSTPTATLPPPTPAPLVIEDFESASLESFRVNEDALNQGNQGVLSFVGPPDVNQGQQALAFDFNIVTSNLNYIGYGRQLPQVQDWSSYTALCFWIKSEIPPDLILEIQIGVSDNAVSHYIVPASYHLGPGMESHCILLRGFQWTTPENKGDLTEIAYYAIFVSAPDGEGEGVIYVDNIFLIK